MGSSSRPLAVLWQSTQGYTYLKICEERFILLGVRGMELSEEGPQERNGLVQVSRAAISLW